CFGAFLLANGIMHVMSALNIWLTAFWLEASLKVITAILAIPTAVLLWRSLPDVLSMPSQRQLRDANESLARANRELEAFTASVSHDLRSPLTTIAGQAGLLEISMPQASRSEEHTSELQSRENLVCRLLLASPSHLDPRSFPTRRSSDLLAARCLEHAEPAPAS